MNEATMTTETQHRLQLNDGDNDIYYIYGPQDVNGIQDVTETQSTHSHFGTDTQAYFSDSRVHENNQENCKLCSRVNNAFKKRPSP